MNHIYVHPMVKIQTPNAYTYGRTNERTNGNAKRTNEVHAKRERKKTAHKDTVGYVHFMQNFNTKTFTIFSHVLMSYMEKDKNIGFLNYGQWQVSLVKIPGASNQPFTKCYASSWTCRPTLYPHWAKETQSMRVCGETRHGHAICCMTQQKIIFIFWLL